MAISKKLNFALAAVSFMIILLLGCNDNPSTLGDSLLNDTLILKAITTQEYPLIESTESNFTGFPGFNVGAILLGKSGGNTASSLLRFGFVPDSLDYLVEDDFESVELILYPKRYCFGDSISNSLSFDIYNVNRLWYNTTTYDSVFVSPANYYDPEIIANYMGNIEFADTIPPVRISLPANLMTEWFKTEIRAKDDGTLDTVAVINYGIALVPNDNSTLIRQFEGEGINSAPLTADIQAIYRNRQSELDTVTMQAALVLTLVDSPTPEEGYITIQGGSKIRTKFTFDVSELPDMAAIHKSQLRLTFVEELSSWGNFGPDSIVSLFFYGDDTQRDVIVPWETRMNPETKQYLFPSISSAVETWTRMSDKKGSLYLLNRPDEDEARQIDRMVFYGLDAPEDLRPELTIIYSRVD